MRGSLLPLFASLVINAAQGQCDLTVTWSALPGSCQQPACVGLSFNGTPPFSITNSWWGLNVAGHPDNTFGHCDFNNTGGEYIVTDAMGCTGSVIAQSYHHIPIDIWFTAIHVDGEAGLLFTASDSPQCVFPADLMFEVGGPVFFEVPMQTLIAQGSYQVMGLPPGMYYGATMEYVCDIWVHCISGANNIYLLNEGDQTGVNVQVNVALAGPMGTGGIMNDDLRAQDLIPLTEPYSGMGYTFTAGNMGASIASALLEVTGNSAVVDWIIIEIRASTAPHAVIASRAALLSRNGSVMDVDGDPYVNFPNVSPGNYRLAIRHRNHLGIMTGTQQPMTNTPPDLIEFRSTSGTSLYGGPTAAKVIGNVRSFWPGDANFDGVVKYSGADNDRDVVLLAIGGSTPSNTLDNVYHSADVNLDGIVKYTGTNNDRDLILQTIGGVVPTAVKVGQLP